MSNRKPRNSYAGAAVLAALIAVSLAACGATAPSPTGPGAGAAGDSGTVILSQAFEDVEPGGQRVIDFNVPGTATLALTVRWNDQGNSVIAVLTGAGCPDHRGAAADCQVRRSVERQGREGREGVINYAGAFGAYHLLLENEGPGAESIRVTVLTSPSAAPVPPTPYPTDPPERNRPTPRRSWEP